MCSTRSKSSWRCCRLSSSFRRRSASIMLKRPSCDALRIIWLSSSRRLLSLRSLSSSSRSEESSTRWPHALRICMGASSLVFGLRGGGGRGAADAGAAVHGVETAARRVAVGELLEDEPAEEPAVDPASEAVERPSPFHRSLKLEARSLRSGSASNSSVRDVETSSGATHTSSSTAQIGASNHAMSSRASRVELSRSGSSSAAMSRDHFS